VAYYPQAGCPFNLRSWESVDQQTWNVVISVIAVLKDQEHQAHQLTFTTGVCMVLVQRQKLPKPKMVIESDSGVTDHPHQFRISLLLPLG